MTETTPEQILARAQVPSANGRPIRKDEIELHDRGIYIESWLPERRSRRKPLLFVHGELTGSWLWERYLGYFASRGWEGHALNLQNHFWSRTVDPAELTFESYVEDVVASLDRLGPTTVVIGHGLGALLALKAAEQAPIGGLVLLSPEPPAALRPPAPAARAARRPRGVRPVAGSAGRRCPRSSSATTATSRSPTSSGSSTSSARSRTRAARLAGRCWPACRSTRGRSPRSRGWSSGRVSTSSSPEPVAERVAEWLGADYEPFGAHSHYGLIVGEQSHQQVADAIRGFLELNRL